MPGPLRTWLLPALFFPALVLAATETGSDPQSGLRFWEWSQDGVSVRLVQRLPDQTRGFFLARGFRATEADRIARACVFQTIFRNDGARPVDFDLRDWRVLHQGRSSRLRVREDWDALWPADTVSKAARIALRWSLLPTRQHFEPGDYNWGMSAYGLAPGSRFDLRLVMHIGGQPVEALLPGIECPRDGDQP
ncbi:hypothetical protein [endosymbiont of unidentified scaly snail isolate Monju]|uniref:hypothetical protein n=1 Tax=endosymbiont of unidentified scaly snail isolate Monju TaxID=1248727 RepID=UPI0003892737|nr:hypothetical protein [endosymbiont of unidentified scaly snail isolate Monju]BAN69315.1 conserved hypothetical protein [endosymbiont of unidentified scaly snail isolate Monju]